MVGKRCQEYLSVTKPPLEKTTKSTLEASLDSVGIALLDAAYGHLLKPNEDGIVEQPEGTETIAKAEVDPKVFNAIVGWIRVKNKLEPDDDEPSGLGKLRGKFGK